MGCADPGRGARRRAGGADDRRPVLPGPGTRGQHRVHRRAVRGHAGNVAFAALLALLVCRRYVCRDGAGGGGTGYGRPQVAMTPAEPEHLAALDVPILQALCLTSSRAKRADNDDGMSPLDVATQVAVPGVRRPDHHCSVLVQRAYSEGLIAYTPDPETVRAEWPDWRSDTRCCAM